MVVNVVDAARNLEELCALVVELVPVFVKTSFDAIQLIFHGTSMIRFELCTGLACG